MHTPLRKKKVVNGALKGEGGESHGGQEIGGLPSAAKEKWGRGGGDKRNPLKESSSPWQKGGVGTRKDERGTQEAAGENQKTAQKKGGKIRVFPTCKKE